MYKGWSNYQTYNVALWITNDHRIYRSAIASKSYDKFVQKMHAKHVYETLDGVSLTDENINREELAEIWERVNDVI